MEHHGVASGSRGPPACWNHLLPVAPAAAVEAETEEARGEEVVLGTAARHIEPDVVHQSSRMTCQAWWPRRTRGRWCEELPVAPAQWAEGPNVTGEGAISQLTTHEHQEARPSHSHVGVPGSLWIRDRETGW